ncbi:MAG: c-type cytochrome biogenesis protein CcmI [Rhodobacteraceae bacterium]|nr:c-type cytochrome biogenesis protein CcmI [Paracoccaceae bacterium]
MAFWLVALVLSVAAIGLALRPLWSGRGAAPSRAAHEVEALKSQLTEIDRDLERGVITAEEAEGGRRELSRKLLAAAERAERDGDIAAAPQKAATISLAIGSAAMAVGALAVYLSLGSPGAPDTPLSTRDFASERSEARLAQAAAEKLYQESGNAAPPPPSPDVPEGAEDFNSLLARTEQAIAERPTDAQGRLLLAGAYERVARHGEAWPLYAEAIKLMGVGAPPALYASQGEAMVMAAGGYVSREAAEVFSQAPAEPQSRYFLGLAAAQDGDARAALTAWIGLLRDAPDAPFAPMLRQQIQGLAAEAQLQINDGVLPPPPETAAAPGPFQGVGPDAEQRAAAADMTAEERQEMIEGMVGGLADRLKESPDDLNGWLRLLRSYRMLGREDDAVDALKAARTAFADNPQALAQLAEAGAWLDTPPSPN